MKEVTVWLYAWRTADLLLCPCDDRPLFMGSISEDVSFFPQEGGWSERPSAERNT